MIEYIGINRFLVLIITLENKLSIEEFYHHLNQIKIENDILNIQMNIVYFYAYILRGKIMVLLYFQVP